MKKQILQFEIALWFLIFSAGLSEEVTQALPQTGSHRAFAMGGTFIAFDTGVNALFGNPAGLPDGHCCEILIGHYWQIHKTMQFKDSYYSMWNGSRDISYKPVQRFNYVGVSFQTASADSQIQLGGAIGFSSFYNWRSARYEDQELGSSLSRTEEHINGLYDLFGCGFGISSGGIGAIGISVSHPFLKQYVYKYHYEHTYSYAGEIQTVSDHYKNIQKVSAQTILRIGGMMHVTPDISLGLLWNRSYSYKIEDQKRVFPGTLNFGIACRPAPDLLIAADLESRPWSKVKINDEYIGNAQSGTAYRFGAEYGEKFTVRAGYARDILPVLDINDHSVSLNDITFGIGWKANTFIVDVGVRCRFSTYAARSQIFWEDDYDYCIRDWALQSSIKFIQ